MYSELFILILENVGAFNQRRYIIDYTGNKSKEEIRKDVEDYIKKHKKFYSSEFSKEYLKQMGRVYYIPDMERIEISIPKSTMNIRKL